MNTYTIAELVLLSTVVPFLIALGSALLTRLLIQPLCIRIPSDSR